MTYKLSQDHVETIFSVIRGRGGSNDNPNCQQFKTAIKAILMHNELKSSMNANCESDDTVFLKPALQSKPKEFEALYLYEENVNLCEEDADEEVFLPPLSDFVNEVVIYIAGFVERRVKRTIKCDKCLTAIDISPQKYSEIVNIKSCGSLVHPHEDTYRICETAEKDLRAIDLSTNNNFYESLSLSVLKKVEGVFENCCSPEHASSIIKLILKLFLTVRLHHIAKERKYDMTKKMVRHKNTKSTHQQNQ